MKGLYGVEKSVKKGILGITKHGLAQIDFRFSAKMTRNIMDHNEGAFPDASQN